MKLRGKIQLLLWMAVVFVIFMVLLIWTMHKTHPIFTVVLEIGIPVLYLLTAYITYRSFRPIEAIARSLNLLREEDFTTTLVTTGNTEVDQIIEIYNSMIHRLRKERLTVREQNQFLDLLIESSPQGILVMDFDNRIIKTNPSTLRFFAIPKEELIMKPLSAINNKLANQLETIGYNEKRVIDLADGGKFLCRKHYFMDSGFKHPFYVMEELTDEIRSAEKEAYGKIIRMMAHEVNNTIGAVNSIVSSVQTLIPEVQPEEVEETVHMLEIALQRNYQLNRFMQNFSDVVKLPAPMKTTFLINDSVKAVAESLQPMAGEKGIVITLNFQNPSIHINADQSQMEMVWINLLKNAIEASQPLGEIIITIAKKPLEFKILDCGPGIPADISDKIFTPFFSTKPTGQGIGLTLIREILVNHGFPFHFTNHHNGGAEFLIRLEKNR